MDFEKEFLQVGLYNQQKPENIDDEELQKGIKVEKEHTTNDEIAKKIALDHLAEHPKYYTYLEKMEQQMKQDIQENNDNEMIKLMKLFS